MTDLLCPLALRIEPMQRLFVLNFVGDPRYEAIELQRFDDSRHGTGLAVLLYRKDRAVDVYREPGVRLDRAMFTVGAGVGVWQEVSFEAARFEADAARVEAEVALRDAEGRPVSLTVRPRADLQRPITLLAPVGSDVDDPASLFLVYMYDFDLLRRAGYDVSLEIDGQARKPAGMPIPFGLRRVFMARYSPDPVVVVLNPSHDGAAPLLPVDDATGRAAGDGFVAELTEDGRVARLSAEGSGHRATLELGGFPDPRRLGDGEAQAGAWSVRVDDGPDIIRGRWTSRREGDEARVELAVTRGWRPGRVPVWYRAFFLFARFFKTWPRSYAWEGILALGGSPQQRSRWTRRGKA